MNAAEPETYGNPDCYCLLPGLQVDERRTQPLNMIDSDLDVAEGSNVQVLLELVYGQQVVPRVVRVGDRNGVENEIEDEAVDEDILLSIVVGIVERGEHILIKWIFHRSGPLTSTVCWRR